ncbi:SRPBCC domain-containing protein [Paenibacillus sp. FSL W8-1187]|uniref:Putative glutathione S-transferase-related transmembrane protein n=1 Tax=Paenibacillus pasadenensis TaxID=217090 RepID=A0A2N5N1M5_9BACL|nr:MULTISPECIES: SRPBCC domain-containing protein [Paenibacillus]PLT44244.1 putative glutathione S-transferase-related transmembrane protein [Paenibacillus pasadenensis]QGG54769.1 SRPBCC domain-containing protein [Paenibacillus sp. B01]
MTTSMRIRVEGNQFIMERTFGAPKDLVFRAFTEAEHLKKWWGPRGWTLTRCDIDFRPGGVWHYCMKCEDPAQGDFYGMESWGKTIYKETNPQDFYSCTDYFSDEEGTINEELPPCFTELEFVERDGSTTVINRSRYETAAQLQSVIDMGMEHGVRETWDRLEEHLAAVQSA